MKMLWLLLEHFLTGLAKTAQPGGARTIVAENLLLKHQLLVISRARRGARNLNRSDRLFLGLLSFFWRLRRIAGAVVIFTEFGPSYRTCTDKFQWHSIYQGLYQVPLVVI
jgi:hypothetical protein